MLAAQCRLDRRQAIVEIGISPFNPESSENTFNIQAYRALIDTGAMRTCLTYRAIGLEGLVRHSRKLVKNVHNQNLHGLYMTQLGIFATHYIDGRDYIVNRSYFRLPNPTEVMDIADNDRFDAILGMDILEAFDFRFERDGTATIFLP